MKNLILVQLIILSTLSVSLAQVDDPKGKPVKETKTLFGKDSKVRGFFTIDAQGSEIGTQPTLFTGLSFGMLINNHFILGLGGYGITTHTAYERWAPSNYDPNGTSYERVINGGYGGLLLGFIIAPKEAVHISFPVIIGAGGLSVDDRDYYTYDDYYYYNDKNNTSAFFVVEPAVEIEINVTKFFKLGLRGSYRHTRELDLEQVSAEAFDNFNGGLSFKFGKF